MKISISTYLLPVALICLPFMHASADQYDDLVQAAIDEPGRLERNSSRDAARKPDEVIKFFAVQPGMTVLDVLATGGYYTEILAGVVGDSGRVISHEMAAEGMDPDYYFAAHIRNSPHLDNVVPIYADLRDLDLKENSLDQVFLIQNFHDLWFDDYAVDPDKTLAVFRKALKSGGTLAVIDHVAEDSAPASAGNSIHRISPTLTRRVLEEAGFVFEAESDILLNLSDDISRNVFAPDLRGKTSRFIHRYRNP
jgi:predicted methyltransferase